MALPTSRNTTYVAGVSQVKAADLNALQDCLIGAKHPEIESPVYGGSFVVIAGTATFDGLEWTGSGAGFTLRSGLAFVPVGSRITRIKYAFDYVSGDVTVALVRVPLAGGALETVAGTVYNTSAGAALFERVFNHTVATGYAYAASIAPSGAADAAGCKPRGASVWHDRL